MKKLALIAALVFGVAMVSCSKDPAKEAAKQMQDAANQTAKQMQDAANQAAQQMQQAAGQE